MHYIAPTSSPSYIARVRAIALPCPPFLHLSPRAAAMYSSSLGAIIYFLWSVAMWRSHTALSRRMQLTAVGSIGELELGGLTAYANWSFYFAGTACVAWFGTFVSTIYPQRDFLRHLSRLNWVSFVRELGAEGGADARRSLLGLLLGSLESLVWWLTWRVMNGSRRLGEYERRKMS